MIQCHNFVPHPFFLLSLAHTSSQNRCVSTLTISPMNRRYTVAVKQSMKTKYQNKETCTLNCYVLEIIFYLSVCGLISNKLTKYVQL